MDLGRYLTMSKKKMPKLKTKIQFQLKLRDFLILFEERMERDDKLLKINTILWCDSVATLCRMFSSKLRETFMNIRIPRRCVRKKVHVSASVR